MEKEIGLGYKLQIVSDFKCPEMLKVCTEWSRRTQGKPDVVPRTTAWLVNNLVFATLVYAPDGSLVGTAGMVRSYEEKRPVYYKSKDGQIFDLYELLSNVVIHEGMGIADRMMAERLLIADQKNWATATVTKNKAIIHCAGKYGMIQTSESKDESIMLLGHEIRTCVCENPNEKTPFFGLRCDTCPRNGGEGSKRIFFRAPHATVIHLPQIHARKVA